MIYDYWMHFLVCVEMRRNELLKVLKYAKLFCHILITWCYIYAIIMLLYTGIQS